MKKYQVHAMVCGGKYLGEYEANSKEEAETMALNKEGYIALCHQCAHECEDAEIQEVTVEEME